MECNFVTLKPYILKDMLVVGVPGVFQNVLNVVSMTILNNLLKDYGANVVTAVGIANKINQLPIQIVFGFTQGVMSLIGYNFASKNFPRMKESIKKTYIVTLCVLAVVLLLTNVAGEVIIRKLFLEIPFILLLNYLAGVMGWPMPSASQR